ncbi:MAG: hypothetical protein FJ041_03500, partial [Candidatus Cloacimonetes bacterium]|nr:hypothetical protein [Candidatus Cloacimonadota bacterium]
MVQRTKLAVVFLLAVIAGILSAQESGFIMPKIISDPVLEIPVNWKQTYMPAEVMILVDIKADSTVSLLRILDGKTELQPLIEEQLPYLKFTPAIRNGIAIDANLSLKLKIIESEIATYTEQKTTADSLRLLRKAELLSWINRQRQADDLQKMFSSNADAGIRFAPQLTDAFYRTNFRLMGLNSKPYLIFNNGFIQPAGLFYDAVMLQMLANFKRLRANESNILFANEKFTLPAMCTDVYAGLGDYEHNFARVLTFKNHMLGVKDFYSEMGFLVQNGFWQEVVADQTSTRLFL